VTSSLTLFIFTPCASYQGTTLICNLSSVLKDETVWEKPLRFYPEHFLDAQGHFVKPEAFMPFSAGISGVPVCLSIPGIPWRVEHQSVPS
jgi:cytochrome P450